MSKYQQEILIALFLTILSIHSLWTLFKRRPLVSVENARSLTFAAGLLASGIYYWYRLLLALS